MSIRLTQPAFPGFPGDRLQFPRLQLRGSAGVSPASLSFTEWQKTRIPKDIERAEKARARNVTGGWELSQIGDIGLFEDSCVTREMGGDTSFAPSALAHLTS